MPCKRAPRQFPPRDYSPIVTSSNRHVFAAIAIETFRPGSLEQIAPSGPFVSFGTKVSAALFAVNEKNAMWQLYPAVLFPGDRGHNVGRRLWISRVLSTPPPTNNVSRTCVFCHLFSSRLRLSPRTPFINVLCFSPLSYHSLFRPYHFCARVTISCKGCLFCKSAKLVKVTSRAEPVAKTELSRGDIEDRW